MYKKYFFTDTVVKDINIEILAFFIWFYLCIDLLLNHFLGSQRKEIYIHHLLSIGIMVVWYLFGKHTAIPIIGALLECITASRILLIFHYERLYYQMRIILTIVVRFMVILLGLRVATYNISSKDSGVRIQGFSSIFIMLFVGAFDMWLLPKYRHKLIQTYK